MRPAADIGGISMPINSLLLQAIGILILLMATVIAARLVSRFVTKKAHQRHMRTDMVVVTRRAVYAGVIGLGVFLALGWAAQNANVTLFGLLVATVVAALGVQQLLQDYVSGYYVLLERHIRVGDQITFDGNEGTITDVRLRVTLLRNDQGDMVVVPNSELFTKPVTIRARAETRTAPPE